MSKIFSKLVLCFCFSEKVCVCSGAGLVEEEL